MNEGQGGWLYDISGRNNTATVSGAQWRSGQFGPCLDCDDPGGLWNAKVNPLPANLQITSNITVALWFRPGAGWDSASYSYLIDTNNDADGFTFQTGDAGIYISYIARDQFAGVTFTVGVWTHIAMVHDGSTLYLYIDGKEFGTWAAVGTQSFTAGSLTIGNSHTVGNFSRGHHDDVRIYNRGLSPTEIRQLVMYPFADFAYPNLSLMASIISAAFDPATIIPSMSQMESGGYVGRKYI